MTRLWLPFTVTDLPAAVRFYRDRLGLPVVDGWRRDGEEGVVLGAETAFIELVTPEDPRPAPLAFEVPDVDAVFARMSGDELVAAPHRYPRGHHGFEVRGPAGATVMVWSE
ncbi:VOC family protein [Actinophytocola sp.]|uniref:VOC family protein n=1 Tax=Actinophytocola sp. TaxID=1872138 RepID=UPI002ED00220